ncbi:hypothetical protein D9M72_546970 [compost metagenome]
MKNGVSIEGKNAALHVHERAGHECGPRDFVLLRGLQRDSEATFEKVQGVRGIHAHLPVLSATASNRHVFHRAVPEELALRERFSVGTEVGAGSVEVHAQVRATVPNNEVDELHLFYIDR